MGNFDFDSGRAFLEEDDYVEAIRSLLASLEQDPSHVESYVLLARAYERAWDESGDPLVLDQIRKVAIAGLKRVANPDQRCFLQEALDRTEGLLIQLQREEEEAAARETGSRRKLPMAPDRE